MTDTSGSDTISCFKVIAITTTAIAVIDLVARAFCYAQALRFTPYLPLLIGVISLCCMRRTKKAANTGAAASQSNMTPHRRVRVTGPIK